MNTTYIVLSILILLGILIVVYRVFKHHTKQIEYEYIENNEFQTKNTNDNASLMMFHAKWCNHSRKSKKIWDEIKKDNQFKKFNLNFYDFDCDDKKNKKIMEEYKIMEFPTIVLHLDETKYVFDANLNKKTLMKFLTMVYSNN